jgi:hypothetical protein
MATTITNNTNNNNNNTNITPIHEFHPEIKKKLASFIQIGKIPHIIFHGSSGSGKRTIVKQFISDIYKNNKELIKSYVMYVNCAHGKGIKFVRDELKFFAKTHVNVECNGNFKTIVLSNADELTIDAQSALRRCIELFSHTTRFIIIVQDKYKLLKPILSRLCEIFVDEPILNGKRLNLHQYGLKNTFHNISISNTHKRRDKYFDSLFGANVVGPNVVGPNVVGLNVVGLNVVGPNANVVGPSTMSDEVGDMSSATNIDYVQMIDMANKLYEKGYSGLDLMNYIEHNNTIDDLKKYQLLIVFRKIKKEFRNEQLFILFILNFMLIRSNHDLENISFM